MGKINVDQIFTMRETMEECWEQNIDVHHLFINFQATYDTMENANME
jgi:hypothetical protein